MAGQASREIGMKGNKSNHSLNQCDVRRQIDGAQFFSSSPFFGGGHESKKKIGKDRPQSHKLSSPQKVLQPEERREGHELLLLLLLLLMM